MLTFDLKALACIVTFILLDKRISVTANGKNTFISIQKRTMGTNYFSKTINQVNAD